MKKMFCRPIVYRVSSKKRKEGQQVFIKFRGFLLHPIKNRNHRTRFTKFSRVCKDNKNSYLS